MTRTGPHRACRHDVDWPARVRCTGETGWHFGQVINLSVTGVLLRTERRYHIGERVEVEIDFLSELDGAPDARTVVAGLGRIVRTEDRIPGRSAVHFVVECGLSTRDGSDERDRPKYA